VVALVVDGHVWADGHGADVNGAGTNWAGINGAGTNGAGTRPRPYEVQYDGMRIYDEQNSAY
jgi:hypothetical protein